MLLLLVVVWSMSLHVSISWRQLFVIVDAADTRRKDPSLSTDSPSELELKYFFVEW
jgi:hypothetical protein